MKKNCLKYTITNTGTTTQYVNYQRCSDNLVFYEVDIAPGQTKRFWVLQDSFQTFDNPTIQLEIEPFPPKKSPRPKKPINDLVYSLIPNNDLYYNVLNLFIF
jgi:hypothetical protein